MPCGEPGESSLDFGVVFGVGEANGILGVSSLHVLNITPDLFIMIVVMVVVVVVDCGFGTLLLDS